MVDDLIQFRQMIDVEQERKDLCPCDREPKFDPAIIREINAQRAAIAKNYR